MWGGQKGKKPYFGKFKSDLITANLCYFRDMKKVTTDVYCVLSNTNPIACELSSCCRHKGIQQSAAIL